MSLALGQLPSACCPPRPFTATTKHSQASRPHPQAGTVSSFSEGRKGSPEPPQARESCLVGIPNVANARRVAPRCLGRKEGPGGPWGAAAVRAQVFAATSPANSASAGAVDHADQRQRSGWAHSCLRPCGLAPAPSAVSGRGEAESCCSVGDRDTRLPPPRPESETGVS